MILRAPMALGAAALLTTSLFYGMQLLIAVGEMPVMTKPIIIWVDPRIPERKIEPIRKAELPQKIEQVAPPQIDKTVITPIGPGKRFTTDVPVPSAKDGPVIGFKDTRQAQPIFRMEPQFSNITKAEFVTLSFDVARNGAVIKDSIMVLEASSSRLERPAKRAIMRWKYQPKLVEGEAMVQRDLRIVFNVQPAE